MDNLKEKLAKSGWVLTNENFKPPFDFKEELRYNLIGYSVSILAIIPLLVVLVFLYFYLRFKGKNKRPSMLFGTHAVITFKLLKKVLEEEHDCTIFAFKDDFHKVENIDVITAEDIMPKWIAKKYPYLLGRYLAFVWALKNYDIFHLYFDGGFLDRTIWWRLEPIIYQLFGKKVILYPYGADVLDILRHNNYIYKFGMMTFSSKYFNLDFKRIRRNYWWSKYVNFVVGGGDSVYYMPRVDVWSYNIGFVKNKLIDYYFPEITDGINIIHYANHDVRKGSAVIKKEVERLIAGGYKINYMFMHQRPYGEVIELLKRSHIFIENITQGFIGPAAVTEAAMNGKICLVYSKDGMERLYKFICPDYYKDFFDNSPLINVDQNSLYDKLKNLLDKDEAELKTLSHETRDFAEKVIRANEEAYKLCISSIVNNGG